MAVRWRRWTGFASGVCLLSLIVLLVIVALDPRFWAATGMGLGLAMLVGLFLLIANLCLRRVLGVVKGRPAIVVQPGGLLLADGLSQRALPWAGIDRLKLSRNRLLIEVNSRAPGSMTWPLMAQLGLAPALRYLYAAIELDRRGFYDAVQAAAPHLRIDVAG